MQEDRATWGLPRQTDSLQYSNSPAKRGTSAELRGDTSSRARRSAEEHPQEPALQPRDRRRSGSSVRRRAQESESSSRHESRREPETQQSRSRSGQSELAEEEDLSGLLLSHEYFKKELLKSRIDELLKKLRTSLLPVLAASLEEHLARLELEAGASRERVGSGQACAQVLGLWEQRQCAGVLDRCDFVLLEPRDHFARL